MARFVIVNGPSKFDLMLALFEGKRVTFDLQPWPEGRAPSGPVATKREFRISTVQAEDGSYNSWNLEADFVPTGVSNPVSTRTKSMYYHTGNRHGVVSF